MDISLPYHRKYRPKNLSDYIGNEKLKESVLKAVANPIRPQVILLQGEAGIGKTSMARLIAKEYLCEYRSVEDGACGECESCKRIDEYIETGRNDEILNIREVDATDSNKKQDIDNLLEEAAIPSFDGNWKIFILDECHMMSLSAQNRLLKTLEEPPEKVLIIMCTTDPEKLLKTIISRCQYIFKVQKPTKIDILNLLKKVCKNENLKWEAKALNVIGIRGNFVPRNTLITLESVAKEVKDITYENTLQVLNIITDKYFFEFYNYLSEEIVNTPGYINFLADLKSKTDLRVFVDNLLTFTTRGLYVSHGVVAEALDKSEIEQYKKLFLKFTIKEIANILNLLLDIKYSNDIETRLMMLGFKGLKELKEVENKEEMNLIDVAEYSAKEEKAAGNKNYLESITMSEEEIEEKIREFNQSVDIENIASLFGGEMIIED